MGRADGIRPQIAEQGDTSPLLNWDQPAISSLSRIASKSQCVMGRVSITRPEEQWLYVAQVTLMIVQV
jgi:hypothetical protein